MSVFARRPRGPAPFLAGLLAVATLGFGAYGCGAGDDTTAATEPASSTPASSGGSVAAGDVQTPGEAGTRDAQGAGKDGSEASGQASGPGRPVEGKGQAEPVEGDGSGAAGLAPSKYRAAIKKAKDSCPAGISAAQCNATVEKYLDAAPGPTHAAAAPEDCLEIMGQAECEALLTAQQAASEEGDSFSVEQCLQNPTPHCEAVLRPILEQQYASQEAEK